MQEAVEDFNCNCNMNIFDIMLTPGRRRMISLIFYILAREETEDKFF